MSFASTSRRTPLGFAVSGLSSSSRVILPEGVKSKSAPVQEADVSPSYDVELPTPSDIYKAAATGQTSHLPVHVLDSVKNIQDSNNRFGAVSVQNDLVPIYLPGPNGALIEAKVHAKDLQSFYGMFPPVFPPQAPKVVTLEQIESRPQPHFVPEKVIQTPLSESSSPSPPISEKYVREEVSVPESSHDEDFLSDEDIIPVSGPDAEVNSSTSSASSEVGLFDEILKPEKTEKPKPSGLKNRISGSTFSSFKPAAKTVAPKPKISQPSSSTSVKAPSAPLKTDYADKVKTEKKESKTSTSTPVQTKKVDPFPALPVVEKKPKTSTPASVPTPSKPVQKESIPAPVPAKTSTLFSSKPRTSIKLREDYVAPTPELKEKKIVEKKSEMTSSPAVSRIPKPTPKKALPAREVKVNSSVKDLNTFDIYPYIGTLTENIKKLTSSGRREIFALECSTGSGKSVLIPSLFVTKGLAKRIIVSVPTKAAVDGLYNFVTQLFPDISVGYSYDRQVHYTDKTEVIYATNGHVENLMTKTVNSGKRFPFDILVVDEFHIGQINADTSCCLWKKNPKNFSCHLMFLSATVDKEVFLRYGLATKTTNEEGLESTLIDENRVFSYKTNSFPVDMRFDVVGNEFNPMHDDREASKICIDLVMDICSKTSVNEHILIFVDGITLMTRLSEEIRSVLSRFKLDKDCSVYNMHSSIPMEDIQAAMQEVTDHRKIIVATNIAETSITISNVYHVIDFGLENVSMKTVMCGVNLARDLISKSSVTQRKGRTGRTNPGTYYALYGQKVYDEEMQQIRVREILRLDINTIMLRLIGNGISYSVLDIWMHNEDIIHSINSLFSLGFINVKIISKQICEEDLPDARYDLLHQAIMFPEDFDVIVEPLQRCHIAKRLTLDYRSARVFCDLIERNPTQKSLYGFDYIFFALSLVQIGWDRIIKVPNTEKFIEAKKNKKGFEDLEALRNAGVMKFKSYFYNKFFSKYYGSCEIETYMKFWKHINAVVGDVFNMTKLKEFCDTNWLRFNVFKEVITHFGVCVDVFSNIVNDTTGDYNDALSVMDESADEELNHDKMSPRKEFYPVSEQMEFFRKSAIIGFGEFLGSGVFVSPSTSLTRYLSQSDVPEYLRANYFPKSLTDYLNIRVGYNTARSLTILTPCKPQGLYLRTPLVISTFKKQDKDFQFITCSLIWEKTEDLAKAEEEYAHMKETYLDHFSVIAKRHGADE